MGITLCSLASQTPPPLLYVGRTRQEQIRKERDIQLERMKKQHNTALAQKIMKYNILEIKYRQLFPSESSQRSKGSVDKIYKLNQNLSESQDYWKNFIATNLFMLIALSTSAITLYFTINSVIIHSDYLYCQCILASNM